MIKTKFQFGQRVLIHRTKVDADGLEWVAEDSGIVSGLHCDPRSVPFHESSVMYTVRFGPGFSLIATFCSADLKETPND